MVVSKRWFEFCLESKFRYPPFYLNLTSFLPQFYLFLTSFLPFFNLNLTSASSRISNHGLETTVYRLLAFCAKQTFLQGNGLPSAVLQGNGLPSAVVTRHPLGLGKSVQSWTGLGSCKSHLQVQTPQGRSLASASGSGQAIDLCFERSPLK